MIYDFSINISDSKKVLAVSGPTTSSPEFTVCYIEQSR
jgi:hypothetical protein